MPRDDACANWCCGTDEKQCLTTRGQPRLIPSTSPIQRRRRKHPSPPFLPCPIPLLLSTASPSLWMQTFQPRVYTSPVLGQIYKRADRFLSRYARSLLASHRLLSRKSFAISAEKRSIYLFILRVKRASLIDIKLFDFPYYCEILSTLRLYVYERLIVK